MGERRPGTTTSRIADLRAYLRGEVVLSAKGRPWPRGKEDLAREELRRMLGPQPPRPTVHVMEGGETGEVTASTTPAWTSPSGCIMDFGGVWLDLATLCPAPTPRAP
jgi:hypothetical protein